MAILINGHTRTFFRQSPVTQTSNHPSLSFALLIGFCEFLVKGNTLSIISVMRLPWFTQYKCINDHRYPTG